MHATAGAILTNRFFTSPTPAYSASFNRIVMCMSTVAQCSVCVVLEKNFRHRTAKGSEFVLLAPFFCIIEPQTATMTAGDTRSAVRYTCLLMWLCVYIYIYSLKVRYTQTRIVALNSFIRKIVTVPN